MANHSLRINVHYRVKRMRIVGASELDRVSAAGALSLAVTLLFSTLLVWAKESYVPLHAFMATLTGHHWTTHGLVDVTLFALLGVLFYRLEWAERIGPRLMVMTLIASVIAAGLGIVGYFLFF